MENLIIRQAKQTDIEKLTQFYAEEFSNQPPLEVIKQTVIFNLFHRNDFAPTHFWLAQDEHEIAALVVARYRASFKAYEIESITGKRYRRRGIASHLINLTIQKCFASGFFQFFANISPRNTNSIKLVQKLRFELATFHPAPEMNTYKLSLNKDEENQLM
ncbi:N-acetyltransferase family protein [Pseudomonas sp. SDO55104_S430]